MLPHRAVNNCLQLDVVTYFQLRKLRSFYVNNQKSHDAPKKSRLADEIGDGCGEIGWQSFTTMAWLLMSFLFC